MPNRRTVWEPPEQQDPVRHLALAIKGLRLGDAITMPNGKVVKSTSVKYGANQQRRFIILPPEDESTPLQRHRISVLNHRNFKTAEETAKAALQEN